MNSLRHAIISALLRYWPTTITSKQVEFWWKQVMLTGSKKLNTILGPRGGRGWIFFGTCHWHHSSWAPTLGVYITLFESLTSPNLCWTKMQIICNPSRSVNTKKNNRSIWGRIEKRVYASLVFCSYDVQRRHLKNGVSSWKRGAAFQRKAQGQRFLAPGACAWKQPLSSGTPFKLLMFQDSG